MLRLIDPATTVVTKIPAPIIKKQYGGQVIIKKKIKIIKKNSNNRHAKVSNIVKNGMSRKNSVVQEFLYNMRSMGQRERIDLLGRGIIKNYQHKRTRKVSFL